MSDPYADAFARDYLASKDFARMYGTDKPVKLRFFQFGVREAKDPTNYRAPAVPKPVVWFVEHQDLPMFVNKTQHEYLLDRFGDEYWKPENRQRILHAAVMCKAWTKNAGDGLMAIVEFSGTDAIGQWSPIGTESADKMRAAAKDLGFTRDKFRRFTFECYPELIGAFDSAEGLADLPIAFKQVFAEYLAELRGHMAQPGERPPPPPPKPAEKHSDPSPEPNFEPTRGGKKGEYDITEDDIPF